MPGFIEDAYRCRECRGVDPGMVGLIVHKPTCSTQPGYKEARMRAAVERAKRRARLEQWARSAEAKRLRDLRTIGRVGATPPEREGA